MDTQSHWEQVYTTKEVTGVSWFREHLEHSLELVDEAGLPADARIIDVGGGASTLVDDLLERGFRDVTVLDISSAALEKTRERLGARAAGVIWRAADVTRAELPEDGYDLWHDRAVFHFLTEREGREAYVRNLERAVRPGGHFVIAVFADDGPLKCSGLAVERFDEAGLLDAFGSGFDAVRTFRERHRTPFDTEQAFIYAHFVRRDG